MINILQLSDVHFTASGQPVEGQAPDAQLDAVLAAALPRSGRPDLVVISGDLTDDGSRAGYDRLAARLELIGAPLLAVPGNHDDPQLVSEFFGHAIHTLSEWRVIGIDTSRTDQIHGTVDVPAEAQRLDDLDDRPTVLVMHHPPVSPSTHEWFQLDDAEEFAAMVSSRAHVRAMLTGHLHQPFEAIAGDTPVLGCPSTLVAIQHEGDGFKVGDARGTGARHIVLGPDYLFRSTVLLS